MRVTYSSGGASYAGRSTVRTEHPFSLATQFAVYVTAP